MSAGISGVFYLDNPEDGASAHLLAEIGITLTRSSERNATTLSALTHRFESFALPLTAEHSFSEAVAYEVVGEGTAAFDVRDSADAFIRITASNGDIIHVAPGIHHRLVAAGTTLVKMPVWPADADRYSKQSTVVFPAPVSQPSKWANAVLHAQNSALPTSYKLRFVPGSAEEASGNIPHFEKPGNAPTRQLVADLCDSFYALGWVTGTGGSISIRAGNRIFMAPSGVQKERMQPQDIFVLDTAGKEIYAPRPLLGKPRLKLSQCAPLFQHAFTLRNAGACIHTHDISAVMSTLQNDTEWRITHQEMIKGIVGHGFLDECVVPIIENTPHECDLADSLEEAMRRYPKSNAVLVRRHGVYVWGPSWEAAKTQAECYHYLFDASVRMRNIGIDPGAVPDSNMHAIGADTRYGSALAATGGKKNRPVESVPSSTASSCCNGAGAHHHAPEHAAVSAGFHGAQGTNAIAVDETPVVPLALAPEKASHVLLDIEGATTPLSFVTDVLFPYAAKHVKEYLASHWGTVEVHEDVTALQRQSRADMAAGLTGATLWCVTPEHVAAAKPGSPANEAAIDAIVGNVTWQMDSNRKTGALKQLQGHVWRAGYEAGSLKGQVFPDTVEALKGWVAAGKKVFIYSSGSREAQRLLFANSTYGDLRPYISGYFDTKVGAKVESGSYKDIVLSLGVDAPSHIVFATDSLAEAKAAAQAGVMVAVTDRPGNLPLPAHHGFPVVKSLLELVAPSS